MAQALVRLPWEWHFGEGFAPMGTEGATLVSYPSHGKQRGTLDNTFSVAGGPNADVQAMTLQSDGKILAGGNWSTWNGANTGGIIRLNPNGGVDSGFAVGSGAVGTVAGLGVLADGSVAMGGSFALVDGHNRNRIAILAANGKLPAEPIQWIRWRASDGGNDHFYGLTQGATDWNQAEVDAQNHGTHLASINDAAEQAFLSRTYLRGLNAIRPFWIGLNDEAAEGSMVWSGGDPLGYTAWDVGEPNNNNNEDYVALNWGYAYQSGTGASDYGLWNDVPRLGSHLNNQGDGPYFGIIELSALSGAPTVLIEPQDATLYFGAANGVLEVGALGSPPLQYQWRQDGVPLPGANGNVFPLLASNPTLSGGYDVVVSNGANSVTSRLAQVSFRTNTVQFGSANLSVGELQGALALPILRSGGTNALPVSVVFGGTAVANADFRAGTGSLAASQTSGSYTFQILDDTVVDGPKTLTVTLTTGGRPDIVVGPQSTLTIAIDDNDTASGPGFGFNGSIRAILPLRDGRVMVGGDFDSVNGIPRPRLARLLPDLSLDTGYTPAPFVETSTIRQIAVQPDGGLVLRGTFTRSEGKSGLLRRLRPDGSEDVDFASLEGTIWSTFSLGTMTVDGDGKIYALGAFSTGNTDGFVAGTPADPFRPILRLLPDGSRDPEFAANFAADPVGTSGLSVTLRRAGGLVFGGTFANTASATNRGRIAGLLANGSFDASFATGPGLSNTVTGTTLNRVNAVATDLQDRVLATGPFTRFGSAVVPGWARLNPDGSLDPTFQPSDHGTNVIQMEVLRNGNVLALRNTGSLEEFADNGTRIAILASGVAMFAVDPAGGILVGDSSATHFQRISPIVKPEPSQIELPWGVLAVSEGATEVRVPVRRVGPDDAAAEVTYRVLAGTAVAGTDFAATQGVLPFAAGQREGFVTVPLTAQNDVPNDDRTLQVELLSTSHGALVPARTTCRVTLEDDDVGLTAEVFTSQATLESVYRPLLSSKSYFSRRLGQRRDGVVHFEWDGTAPVGAPSEYFSMIWTGWVVPESTGTYQFTTLADDGVRLWLDEQLMLANWLGTSAMRAPGFSVDLQAGQPHRLALDYFEDTINATCRLLWKPPGQADWSTVPRRVLRPGVPRGLMPSVAFQWIDDPTQAFRIDCTAEPGRPILVQSSANGIDWRFLAEAVSPGLGVATSFTNAPGIAMPAGGFIRAVSVDGQSFTNDTPLPLAIRISQSGTRVVAGSAGSITLTASANGGTGQTGAWLRDGLPVGSGATLVLDGIHGNVGGNYQAIVTSSFGQLASPVRTIQYITPPAISAPLQPSLFAPDQFAAVPAGIGGLELAFQWFRDGVALPVQTAGQLFLSPVRPDDAGLYSVVATNPAGSITNGPALIRVLAPARLVAPLPPLVTLDPDATLVLTAEIAGSGPFAFQWRLNGDDIPGANGPTYTVSPVNLSHAGTYTVVVTDSFATLTAGPVEVRIKLPVLPGNDAFANAVALDTETSPIAGNNAHATRENGEPNHAARPGSRTVWYSWTAPKNGRLHCLTRGSAFDTLLAVYTGTAVNALSEIASNDDAGDGAYFTSELTFSAVANTRYLVAIAGLGDGSGNYVLGWDFTADAPPVPRFVTQPPSQTAPSGSRVELVAGVDDAASVQWWFNGQPLPGATAATLVLPALGRDQVGTYQLAASGGGQTVLSHEAIVEIGDQPGVRSYDKLEDILAPSQGGPALAAAGKGGLGVPPLLLSPGRPGFQTVNNTNATTEIREANHCGTKVSRSRWFPLLTQAAGRLVIRSVAATSPTVMAVYRESDLSEPAACATGDLLVIENVQAGETLLVVVGSASRNGGSIPLEFLVGVPPPVVAPDTGVPNVDRSEGSLLTLRAYEADLVPAPQVIWLRNGVPVPGADGREFALGKLDGNKVGRYSVILDNGLGRVTNGVAEVSLDVPLAAAPGSAQVTDTVFRWVLRGNPGQRVAVDRYDALTEVLDRYEDWLGDGGLVYQDSGPGTVPMRFYRVAEQALRLDTAGKLTDGKKVWRVTGGRLGRSYVIESSTDNGKTWSPFQTNRVERSASYQFLTPANDPRIFRIAP